MPRESACIPPPSSYTSKGPPNVIKDAMNAIGKQDTIETRRPSTRFVPSSSNSRPLFAHFKNAGFRDDDDYFDRDTDDDDDDNGGKRQHLSTETNESDNEQVTSNNNKRPLDDEEDDEDDPLDAFMKTLDENTTKSSKKDFKSKLSLSERETKQLKACSSSQSSAKARGVRLDIDDVDDDEESYYRHMAENPRSHNSGKTEEEQAEEDDKMNSIDYDEDGNPIMSFKLKKEIDPLPSIDHSQIEYANFDKCFYEEHEDIKRLTDEQAQELRAKLEIRVSGVDPPRPICSFAHFGFDEQLMRVIRKSSYSQPTPIQAQAVPAALLGRNLIGIAMTGSGKTAAYLWPMIVHIMGQPDLKLGDGPIGLILVPTRELALQVYSETKKFASTYNIATICAYGGGSKYEQSRDFESGAEVVVATPGRMIDMIKLKVTNLRRVTYLVLDEADRMFDMGFEPQVRSLCDHVRPDRQILMFSATFKKKIERLARHVIVDPIKIVQKELGEANEDVTQHVIVFPLGPARWEWLISRIVEFLSSGSVLIFVSRKDNADELYQNLEANQQKCLLLHGDMEQSARNRVITAFKKKELPIMVATDIASRGLDIPHIRTVINYDVARDIDTHVHRIGRTGRAGTKGTAYTLVTEKDKEFAGHLVRNLESCNQKVNHALMELAMKSNWFRKSRFKGNQKRATSSNNPFHQARRSGLGYGRRMPEQTNAKR